VLDSIYYYFFSRLFVTFKLSKSDLTLLSQSDSFESK